MAEVKEASKIPSSCSQTESTVLEAPLLKSWSLFRGFAFEKIAPGQVTATEYESGAEGAVGSVIKMTYKDGSIWKIRVTEFSERNHTLAYELLTAEPAHASTSVQGEIKLLAVTTDDHTFVSWTTEFSNDADLTVISDQKYKKQEFFKDVKSNL
ncbi:Polyketide cyclase / dehydrase and lipid transport [Seminavis robusta]|uniref:Polyketide cyclase / dehydrase and lipid transport n=1 Tax=Seminavis robusta TaxID=568900 RepID=A0A9N8HGA0_9STRA|nr:Polyketide cyclase / dehydrase and lipid transport [Seminavis robusta]|eukprot:Sro565_g167670.1 Polyketide cyclase / dehydrase and lipid transport (154) ;mRNA; f:49354-49928